MDENSQKPAGDTDDIRELSGIEAVRQMPGMYMGGTDQQALHHVVWNLIKHAIMESLNRPGNQISVTIEPGNIVTVMDNGTGLPISPDQWTRTFPRVEPALARFHGASTRVEYAERVGHRYWAYNEPLFIPVGLAEKFTVEIKQQGALWRINYNKGELRTPLERIAELADPTETGTTLIFQPDYTIFQPVDVDNDYIFRTLRELAFLMTPFTVTFADERPGVSHPSAVFHYPEGTADFVRYLNRDQTPLHDPLVIRKTGPAKFTLNENAEHEIEIDIAVQYTDNQQYMLLNYVNGVEVKNGGVHVQGFIEGLYNGLNRVYDESSPESHHYTFITESEILRGMTAVVSIWLPGPQFEGPVARKLVGEELKQSIVHLVWESIYEPAPGVDDLVRVMLAKCLKNRAELSARRYGD